MSSRNAASRRVPRLLTLLTVLTLAFGADSNGRYIGWTRAMWTQAARASTGGGTLPAFRYTSASPYYNQTYEGLPLRCRQYIAPGHVTVVCALRKTPPKA